MAWSNWGWCQQWVQAAAAAPIAPQEQGEVEKPSGLIGAGSRCSHPMMVLNDLGPCQALAASASTGQDHGAPEQRIFSNHQRLAPVIATSAPPWSGTPAHLLHHPTRARCPCSILCHLLPKPAMFRMCPLVVSEHHSNWLFSCSVVPSFRLFAY
uniref:Uncharacterized protein n=1 Tax=Myotis myotis TaxID=51298 RepID=A0A7J7ZXN5_MYOMY|nr:hypothetical protein mMyoMyo1_009883 [Myotis myotis]